VGERERYERQGERGGRVGCSGQGKWKGGWGRGGKEGQVGGRS